MTKGTNNNKALGDYVANRRAAQGLSISTCAKLSELHESYWRKLEAGTYESPDAKTLRLIADTLNSPIEDLYVLCGYTMPTDLPTLGPYLRATTDLSPHDIAVMELTFKELAKDDEPGRAA